MFSLSAHSLFLLVGMPYYQKWSVRQCPLGGCGAVKHNGWRSYEGAEQCRQNLLQHLNASTYHEDRLFIYRFASQVCRYTTPPHTFADIRFHVCSHDFVKHTIRQTCLMLCDIVLTLLLPHHSFLLEFARVPHP